MIYINTVQFNKKNCKNRLLQSNFSALTWTQPQCRALGSDLCGVPATATANRREIWPSHHVTWRM